MLSTLFALMAQLMASPYRISFFYFQTSFAAGTETTRRTLSWFFLLMITHPDIQEKLARQIHDVIGDRTPSLTDRPSLPLVEAALLETLRFRPITAIGVPHAPSKDGALLLGKYCIPENTPILLNQHALHMDTKHWRDPEVKSLRKAYSNSNR